MKRTIRTFLKQLKPLDLILVEWVDAEQESAGWQDFSSPIGTRFVVAQTVGFYSSHNRTLLRTYSNYDPSNGMGTGRDDIPLTAIKAIHNLKVTENVPVLD